MSPTGVRNISLMAQTSVGGWRFASKDIQTYTFRLGDVDTLTLSISPSQANSNRHSDKDEFIIKLGKQHAISADAWVFFCSLMDGTYRPYEPSQDGFPCVVDGTERISAEGTILAGPYLPFRLYPEELKAVATVQREQLIFELNRIIGLLSWRQRIETLRSPVNDAHLYWGLSNKLFIVSEPPKKHQFHSRRLLVTIGESEQAQLASLWRVRNLAEPLSRELLREAAALADSSPRSSILTAVSALETGTKNYIAALAPDTSWLLDHIQSPPTVLLLRKFIPELHLVKGVDVTAWQELAKSFNELDALVKIRNKIAHSGKVPLNTRHPMEYIELISDVLYVMDVLSGYDWAKELVSFDLKRSLRWPGWNKPYVKFVGGYIVGPGQW